MKCLTFRLPDDDDDDDYDENGIKSEMGKEKKKILNPLVSVKCYLPTCHATSHIHTFIVVIISCGI